MPKQTFLNLSTEKQETFINAALAEFAVNDFQKASISKIVKNLKIAKGSVYQYFENKKDLYLYLIEVAANKKRQYVMPLMQRKFKDFWEQYEAMYLEGIRFDLENPLHSGFLYAISQERYSEELGNLMFEYRKQGLDVMKQLIQPEWDAGRIRPDLSVDAIAYHLMQLSMGVMDMLAFKYNIDFRKNLEEHKPILALKKEEVMNSAREMLNIMKYGVLK
ncbi:MAG: TetR/AcrR family transcriptional regulator [Aureispira sp.]|nr:TetR/AcrR family transcriptional regulator [Aureispira sp.]